MTIAQAKRTRLKTWKDILASVGETPRNGDTLYTTVRKTLIALGGTPDRQAPMRRLAEQILALSPSIYSANGKWNGRLLPQAGGALQWGTDPSTADPFPNVVMFGNPDADVALGNPTSDFALGLP